MDYSDEIRKQIELAAKGIKKRLEYMESPKARKVNMRKAQKIITKKYSKRWKHMLNSLYGSFARYSACRNTIYEVTKGDRHV